MGKLVLGTVQFGLQYGVNSAGRPSEETVKGILAEAAKGGIDTLDTSSAYGNSEEILGECITPEEGFKIISKYPKGVTPVAEMFNGSLKRLKVDKLYGYLLHHFDFHHFYFHTNLRLKFHYFLDHYFCLHYLAINLQIIHYFLFLNSSGFFLIVFLNKIHKLKK